MSDNELLARLVEIAEEKRKQEFASCRIAFRDKQVEIIGNRKRAQADVSARPMFIVHLFPSNNGKTLHIDLDKFMKTTDANPLSDFHYSFDGLISKRVFGEGSFIQIFRDGVIELVSIKGFSRAEDPKTIYTLDLINILNEAIGYSLGAQKSLGIPLPIMLYLTIIDIGGYKINFVRRSSRIEDVIPIGEHKLEFQPIELAEFNFKLEDLRLIMDHIYNACGIEKSQDFDEKGNIVKR